MYFVAITMCRRRAKAAVKKEAGGPHFSVIHAFTALRRET